MNSGATGPEWGPVYPTITSNATTKVLTVAGGTMIPTWADPTGGGITTASNGLTVTTGNVELGGTGTNALTKDITIDQSSHNLTFGGTGKTIVNGVFQTNGAVYAKFRVADDNVAAVIQPTDYIVDLRVSGSSTTLPDILPNPATEPIGRIIIIRNSSARKGSGGVYTFSSTDQNYIVAVLNTSMGSNITFELICDGTKWVRICE